MTSSYPRQSGFSSVNGHRSLPATWRSKKRDQMIKRRAWFLHSFLCCRLDWENMEDLRRHLSASQAVKTKIRLTPYQLTFGKSSRQRQHKFQRQKFQFDQIHTIEQDELFVNVLLCVFRIVQSVDVQYQIFAFKFSDVADVRAIVATYREWAGIAGTAESKLNEFKMAESTIQARSAFGGSVHSVSMPGRPTNGTFNHAGWSSSTVGRPRPSTGYGNGRRGYSASMGDLTAAEVGSDVFYTDGGVSRQQGRFSTYQPRNRDIIQADVGGWSSSRTANGYRMRTTTEQLTVTSDEGNGSQTSDNNVVFKDVDVQITQRVDPSSNPVFNYQRYRPYASTRAVGYVADVTCQVNFPDGMTEQQMHIAGVLSGGAAVVVTGQPIGRVTLNSSGYDDDDDDDDDESMISGMSSLAYGPEPGLARQQQFNYRNGGVAVANVGGYTNGRQVANGRMSFDDVDPPRRPMSLYDNRYGPDMTSSVHRVYSRTVNNGPAMNGNGYRNGFNDDLAVRRSRNRPSESSGYFQQEQRVRSRSVDPLSGGRYSSYGMYSSHNDLYRPDNFDAMSAISGRSARSAPRSARQVRQTAALISPNVRLNYATRQEVVAAGPQSATSTIYRQAPRPRGPSSAYGGVRNRTLSHRMQ